MLTIHINLFSFIAKFLLLIPVILFVFSSKYVMSHTKSQLSRNYREQGNMRNSGKLIIEDIKKGCKLLSTRSGNDWEILKEFGTLRTEGNYYANEVKPSNMDLERVYMLGEDLSFNLKNLDAISTEDLKAEFGDFVVLGTIHHNSPQTIGFTYKLSSTEEFDVAVTYYPHDESLISSISIYRSLISPDSIDQIYRISD
jgi:hypothetical protein